MLWAGRASTSTLGGTSVIGTVVRSSRSDEVSDRGSGPASPPGLTAGTRRGSSVPAHRVRGRARFAGQHPAGRGERDRATRPLEQLGPQSAFQPPDRLGESGLRGTQPARGATLLLVAAGPRLGLSLGRVFGRRGVDVALVARRHPAPAGRAHSRALPTTRRRRTRTPSRRSTGTCTPAARWPNASSRADPRRVPPVGFEPTPGNLLRALPLPVGLRGRRPSA